MTPGEELILRRQQGRCIQCGYQWPGKDDDGLPNTLCAQCVEENKPKKTRAPSKAQRVAALERELDAWGK
jgi:hypothetical protein